MLIGRGNDEQYGKAFEQLKVDVVDALVTGGLAAVHSERGIITIPLKDRDAKINVDVEKSTSNRYPYNNSGTRISYSGYALGYGTGFKKYLKPAYRNGIWGFVGKTLIAKTQEAIDYATQLYDWRKESESQQDALEAKTREVFKKYNSGQGNNLWSNSLRVNGNRVDINTGWGSLHLMARDGGVSFQPQGISFQTSSTKTACLSPEQVEDLITKIGAIVEPAGDVKEDSNAEG